MDGRRPAEGVTTRRWSARSKPRSRSIRRLSSWRRSARASRANRRRGVVATALAGAGGRGGLPFVAIAVALSWQAGAPEQIAVRGGTDVVLPAPHPRPAAPQVNGGSNDDRAARTRVAQSARESPRF
jgi:hypothetical protein